MVLSIINIISNSNNSSSSSISSSSTGTSTMIIIITISSACVHGGEGLGPGVADGEAERLEDRGKRLHTRNQHLRNHRGFSVAFSDGCSVSFSNGISWFSRSFQRIVTCPADFTGISQWMFSVCFQCSSLTWCNTDVC